MNKVIINSDLKIDEDLKKEIKQLILKTLKECRINNSLVEIFIVNEKLMERLNFKYRRKKKATEVLSFPERKTFFPHPETKLFPLGEIFLNRSIFSAKKVPTRFRNLITVNCYWWEYLVIHSVLHLLGYHHQTIKEQLLMMRKEKFLLEKFQGSNKSKKQ